MKSHAIKILSNSMRNSILACSVLLSGGNASADAQDTLVKYERMVEMARNNVTELAEGELPNIPMPELCWDREMGFYSPGAPIAVGENVYICTYIGLIDDSHNFMWLSR